MSYIPTGLLFSEATKATLSTSITTAEKEQPKCDVGKEWSTSLNKCIPKCPSGESYNTYYNKCMKLPKVCDATKDQVWDPGIEDCFDPYKHDVPWDKLLDPVISGGVATLPTKAHPFWRMKISTKTTPLKTERGLYAWVCDRTSKTNRTDVKLGSGKGNPMSWPTSDGNYVYCHTREPTLEDRRRQQEIQKTSEENRALRESSEHRFDAVTNALTDCTKAVQQGQLPPGYEPMCTDWLAKNPESRVRNYIEYVQSLSAQEQMNLQMQAQASQKQPLPKWVMPAAIAGGAAALLLILKK